jgi:hypothetical protein
LACRPATGDTLQFGLAVSEFAEEFLNENPADLPGGQGRGVFLGAFGKHPGWDDHLEENSQAPDLGLRTPSLVWTKQLLYEQGVGRNIDLGTWEKLEPTRRLEGFQHHFLWHGATGMVCGTMWSSRDGKGRTRYPMVLAAHAIGTHRRWTVASLFPRLEQLRGECQATERAVEVASALERARVDLRGAVADSGRSQSSISDLLTEFVRHPQFGMDHEGVLRVCYQLESQVGPFAVGKYSVREARNARPQELRVPAAGRDAVSVFICWTQLIRLYVDEAAPVLVIWPEGESWVDILIGEPTPEDFACLRTTPLHHPCVSDVPFNLDPAFRTRTQSRLETLVQGDQPKSQTSLVSRLFGSLFR